MAFYKTKWWQRLRLEIHIVMLPLFSVETRFFTEAVERMAFDIARLRVKVWKWSWEFQLYKVRREY